MYKSIAIFVFALLSVIQAEPKPSLLAPALAYNAPFTAAAATAPFGYTANYINPYAAAYSAYSYGAYPAAYTAGPYAYAAASPYYASSPYVAASPFYFKK